MTFILQSECNSFRAIDRVIMLRFTISSNWNSLPGFNKKNRNKRVFALEPKRFSKISDIFLEHCQSRNHAPLPHIYAISVLWGRESSGFFKLLDVRENSPLGSISDVNLTELKYTGKKQKRQPWRQTAKKTLFSANIALSVQEPRGKNAKSSPSSLHLYNLCYNVLELCQKEKVSEKK